MFKQLLLTAACFGYHAGKIEFVGKVKFVPPTDIDTLKSFGFFTDNWGIEYNLTASNTLDYVADPDGGINFAVTDDLGNFCTFILYCHPEDDTCEVINHQPFSTKPLPNKGLSCQIAREDLSSKGLTLNGEPLVEKTTITALNILFLLYDLILGTVFLELDRIGASQFYIVITCTFHISLHVLSTLPVAG